MKTILLVEDDEGVRGMVQDILEYAGYRVISATNGRQGVASMSLFNIDLIVCDIMMPALDGRKMCHIIRAIPRFESVPILLMSAHNEQVRRQFAHAAFLSKPFTVNELLDQISELLDRQGAAV